jgi:hypothetical protein
MLFLMKSYSQNNINWLENRVILCVENWFKDHEQRMVGKAYLTRQCV